MPWFKVDDGFPMHRKVLAIPRGQRRLAAVGAWTLAGAWASGNGTNGCVPPHIVDEFGIPRRVVDDLIASGLWELRDDGQQMHDFLDYNPSAEQVATEREWNRRRQALSRDPDMREAIRARDHDRCRYCGREVNWKDRKSPAGGTYDHVTPRGPDVMDNIVTACRGCNAAKGNRTPDEAGMPLLPPGSPGHFAPKVV